MDHTRFILAVVNNNLYTVKDILSKVNDADKKILIGPFEPKNKPALFYAAQNHNQLMYEYLLANGAEDEEEYRTILTLSAIKDSKNASINNAGKSKESKMTYAAYSQERSGY
jgi:hypothetical protein